MGITRDVLNILENGRTTSTYKLGLLRAITDYVFEHPREPGQLGFQMIPLFWLALRFLRYYWYLESEEVPQIGGETTEARISALIRDAEQGVEMLQLKNPASFEKWLEFLHDPEHTLEETELEILVEVRNLLIRNPITYIRNVAGQEITSLGLVSGSPEQSTVFDFAASYPQQLRRANTKASHHKHERLTLDRLIESEFAFILISNSHFEELARSRVLLRDTINLRWIHTCQQFLKRKGNNSQGADLTLHYPFADLEFQRDPHRVSVYRKHLLAQGLNRCIYSGDTLSESRLHIDHLLPFSFFPRNDFWNLFPASPSINSSKSNRLPDLTDDLKDRLLNHLRAIMAGEDPLTRAESERLMKRIVRDSLPEKEQWPAIILTHIENQHSELKEVVPGNLWTYSPAS
ncbi:MAG: hypothetical protein KDK23_09080 [Leptospiraceae bacterium]|nr:hypothetical protein [Leptospiraceae bacterium]